jgi:hypothetical protein
MELKKIIKANGFGKAIEGVAGKAPKFNRNEILKDEL